MIKKNKINNSNKSLRKIIQLNLMLRIKWDIEKCRLVFQEKYLSFILNQHKSPTSIAAAKIKAKIKYQSKEEKDLLIAQLSLAGTMVPLIWKANYQLNLSKEKVNLNLKYCKKSNKLRIIRLLKIKL